MMTTPDGKSAIDSSNVAINSVASATTVAASTPARTEGGLAAIVVSVAAIGVARILCKKPALNAPLTKSSQQ
jgi:hypothetical protein